MPSLTNEQYQQLVSRGLSESTIRQLASQKGYSLPGGVKGPAGIAVGFAKGAGRTAVGLGSLAQEAGQRILAAATPLSLEQVRGTTGIPALDPRAEAGQKLQSTLEAKSKEERIGGYIETAVELAGPLAAGAKLTGTALKSGGKALYGKAIGLSAQEAQIVQAYKSGKPLMQRALAGVKGTTLAGTPRTAAVTALEKGLAGTESMIGIQARTGAKNLWQNLISPALKKVPDKVDMTQFVKEIRTEVSKIPELSRRRELATALNAFADDYAKAGKVSYEKLQLFKEGWAKRLPDKVYRGKPIAGAFREIQNMAAHLARNKIYTKLGPEVKQAYFDYGNLKNLAEMGQRAMTGAKLKGGAGSFISGIKDMVVVPLATGGGQAIYRAGGGLEFIGKAGLKTLGQLLGL